MHILSAIRTRSQSKRKFEVLRDVPPIRDPRPLKLITVSPTKSAPRSPLALKSAPALIHAPGMLLNDGRETKRRRLDSRTISAASRPHNPVLEPGRKTLRSGRPGQSAEEEINEHQFDSSLATENHATSALFITNPDTASSDIASNSPIRNRSTSVVSRKRAVPPTAARRRSTRLAPPAKIEEEDELEHAQTAATTPSLVASQAPTVLETPARHPTTFEGNARSTAVDDRLISIRAVCGPLITFIGMPVHAAFLCQRYPMFHESGPIDVDSIRAAADGMVDVTKVNVGMTAGSYVEIDEGNGDCHVAPFLFMSRSAFRRKTFRMEKPPRHSACAIQSDLQNMLMLSLAAFQHPHPAN